MRRRAGEATSAEVRSDAELYEKFFRIGFKKQAGGALGIVHTPVEVVDSTAGRFDAASIFSAGLTGTRGQKSSDGFARDGHIHYPLPTDLIAAAVTSPEYCKSYANEIGAAGVLHRRGIELTYHALAADR